MRSSPQSSERVSPLVRLEGVSKSYGDLEVFKNLHMTLERGDKIAFLGPNGEGKSTLARIMAGIEPFQEGRIETGHNVTVSYYAQNQAEALDGRRTVLETLEDVAPSEVRPRLRTLLGCFLFRGDDVFKPVSVLSGGEKSRLALAKMLLVPANFLILDEPTNHLDMRSKAVLQEALAGFEGSFVIVSHDRDFLDPLVNKTAAFGGGSVRVLLGGIDRYLDRLHQEREAEKKRPDAPASPPGSASRGESSREEKERKRDEARRRQEHSRAVRPLKAALDKIEGRIVSSEARKKELETSLSSENAYRDGETARRLSHEYKEVTTNLAYLYDEWTRLEEELESLGE